MRRHRMEFQEICEIWEWTCLCSLTRHAPWLRSHPSYLRGPDRDRAPVCRRAPRNHSRRCPARGLGASSRLVNGPRDRPRARERGRRVDRAIRAASCASAPGAVFRRLRGVFGRARQRSRICVSGHPARHRGASRHRRRAQRRGRVVAADDRRRTVHND
jgi:hypothetical protein